MAGKKVCKKCKVFVSGANCPECNGTQFTESWKGKITIFKPEESVMAQKIGIKKPGVYVIKTS